VLKHFDHLTIVVQDVERAKAFFGVLGFKEAKSVVIAGEPFASYMGVPDIKADHVTLVLENASRERKFSSCIINSPALYPIRTSAICTRLA
jgi:catechol 2,3-dioxygenase-like lactoylglutathione lyase family enzyme